MIGLTKDEIKKEVINWRNSREGHSECSDLGFAIRDKGDAMGKTMDVIMNKILPSLLSHVIEKNNQVISKQLEDK